MTADAAPPTWAVKLHRRTGRRIRGCRVCGHRRTVDTEAGPHCEAHAAQLPPPIVFTRPDDTENDPDV